MGKLFLILCLALWFVVAGVVAEGGKPILLDPAPVVIVPPESEGSIKSRAEDLRNQRRERKAAETPTKMDRIRSKLFEQANEPVNYKMFYQMSLVVPYISTEPPRKNYTVDLSFHFAMGYRLSRSESYLRSRWWGGVRMANFSGSGTYKQTTGRYAYTYSGPFLAWAKFTSKDEEEEVEGPVMAGEATNRRETVPHAFPVQDCIMLMGGAAFLTTFGSADRTSPEAEEDFRTSRSMVFDAPSVWMELSSARVYFGHLGWSYLTGFHFGKGKSLVWVGVATSGWI